MVLAKNNRWSYSILTVHKMLSKSRTDLEHQNLAKIAPSEARDLNFHMSRMRRPRRCFVYDSEHLQCIGSRKVCAKGHVCFPGESMSTKGGTAKR